MTTPTNRQELRLAIGKAWDAYFAKLQALAKREGFHPGPGYDASIASVDNNPLTTVEAGAAYAEFKASQLALSTLYARYMSAPAAVKGAKSDCDRAIRNAQSGVDSAQFSFDQLNDHVEAIQSGSFAKYGITEPDQESLDRLEELRGRLKTATVTADAARVAAEAVLTRRLAELEALRPGVTQAAVKQTVDVGRDECVRMVLETYDGPFRWRDRLPRVRTVRKLTGFRDLTLEEVRRLWANEQTRRGV